MSQEFAEPEIHIEYFLDYNDEALWAIYGPGRELLATFRQPNFKAVFLAGYAYAIRNMTEHSVRGQPEVLQS